MQKLLQVLEALLVMIVINLLLPVIAPKYRSEMLYWCTSSCCKKDDLFKKSIQHIILVMVVLFNCLAGNIVDLVGIDQYFRKSDTITTSETAYNL
ncbi:10881_t:CDS:2 [Funneliformis geosporum]|nr:10881_t:CDS:2 [Funneliformis geosporum]